MEKTITSEGSNTFYRELFHHSPIPKYIYDATTLRFVDVSESTLTIYGYTRDEFLSMTMHDIRPVDEIPSMLDAIKVATGSSGMKRLGIFTHRKKDGSTVKMDVSTQKIMYEGRDCILTVCLDVTEQVFFRNLERLEREILERVMSLDEAIDTTLLEYMKRLEELLPPVHASILRSNGKQLFNLASPSLPSEYLRATEGIMIGENIGSCGTAAHRKKRVIVTDIMIDPKWTDFKDVAGKYGYRSCWSQPILDSKKHLLGTLGLYYPSPSDPDDFTIQVIERTARILGILVEKHEAQEQIQLYSKRLKNLSDNIPGVIFRYQFNTDNTDQIQFVSNGSIDIWGYTPDEVMANTNIVWRHIKDGGDFDHMMHTMWESIQHLTPWYCQFRYAHPNGNLYWHEGHGRPQRLPDGSTMWDSMIVDITEQKLSDLKLEEAYRKLEEHANELAESNEELEQFAFVASHDLQEPLRMISSFLTLIKDRYGDRFDEKGLQYIDFAIDGAKKMRNIILDLLEYSRIGRSEEIITQVDLESVLSDVKELLRTQILESGAQIVHEPLPHIKANKLHIKQIFLNLISNSIKYKKNDESPIIKISCEPVQDAWKFSFSDNGKGISPEYFDKIFAIFQRLDRKSETEGTGIGLSIVKKIINTIGGSISVESEPGVGSTFHFTIPKQIRKSLIRIQQ